MTAGDRTFRSILFFMPFFPPPSSSQDEFGGTSQGLKGFTKPPQPGLLGEYELQLQANIFFRQQALVFFLSANF